MAVLYYTSKMLQDSIFSVCFRMVIIERIEAKRPHIRSSKTQDCVLKVLFDACSQHIEDLVEASNVNEIICM